ncbi:hypothetical protein EVJ58_g7027 [Rhodofomes roseus]|uniref:C2H2-type domain-containing protein n=1 Tax=Rhodofomes roseus TaxID=34475 RepID=A0A4Y9Y4K3_9APHY|nr:hypothetical protein EVJ58_g7027 [Rhodofomes roseus]
MYDHRPYDPRHHTPGHDTRASEAYGDGASDFMNDFDSSRALASTFSHPAGSYTYLAPQAYSYPSLDMNGMSTRTPHARLSVDPALVGPSSAPLHQGGSPIYLHPVSYGGSTSSGYFGGVQPSSYATFNNDEWTTFPYDPTFNPMPLAMQDSVSPSGMAMTSLQPDSWGFKPFEPSPPSNVQITSVSVNDAPSASSPPESSPPSRSVVCQWGQKCGVLLDDLTAAGIARHLKEYHVKTWDNRSRGRCEWHGSPCTNTMMYHQSFGKHIASVHLGATARRCEKCGETFARADTLDRHMKLYCRQRSK